MSTRKRFSPLMIASAGFSAIALMSLSATYAQDSHHPPDIAGPASSQPDSVTKQPASGMPPKGDMMAGEQMPMMKMMQEMHAKMMGNAVMSTPRGDDSPSSQAYNGIINKVRQNMDITFTGNADADFVKAIIPHRQAAVDLAKTALAFGKDPEVKKHAEQIISSQNGEIDWSKDWLKQHSQ